MEQLIMTMDDAPAAPPDIPPPYYMRTFMEGDQEDWCRCCVNGGLGVNEASRDEFGRIMAADTRVDKNNIFFLCQEDGAVIGTATYQYGPKPGEGTIHMVGIIPEYQGRGLAHPMLMYAVRRIFDAGCIRAVLTTDDHRISAIKAYLRCGFAPYIPDEDAQRRWEAVLERV